MVSDAPQFYLTSGKNGYILKWEKTKLIHEVITRRNTWSLIWVAIHTMEESAIVIIKCLNSFEFSDDKRMMAKARHEH